MAKKRSSYSGNREALQDISNKLYAANLFNDKLLQQIKDERESGRKGKAIRQAAHATVISKNLRLEGIALELMYVIESMGYAQHEMLEEVRDYFGPDACERFIKLRINEGKQGSRTVRRNPITPLENQ